MDLLRTYIRAEALESLLAHRAPGRRGEVEQDEAPPAARALSPALPAAASLQARSDGQGDLFSLRVGSPCATLAFGATPDILIRQVLGRGTAPALGRDPGGFPTDWDRGWVGPVALPGSLMEIMAGIALALRLHGDPRVALLVDDGEGSGSGDWHEGLNFAVVQQAPLVLVHHEGGRDRPGADGVSMVQRAEAYGFPVLETVDHDLQAVLEACREAVEAARAGEGVQVVDVRAGEEPAPGVLVSALAGEGVDDLAIEAMKAEARAEMEEAFARVSAEPMPDPRAVAVSPVPSSLPDGLHRVRRPRPWS